MTRMIFALTVSLLALTFPAQASSGAVPQPPPHTDTAQQLTVGCTALVDEESYKDNKRNDYRYLLAGEDGWLFRSRQDLWREFDISEKNLALFKRLTDALKSRGIDLVIVLTPTRGMGADGMIPNDPLTANYDPADARKRYGELLERVNKEGVRFVGTPEIKAGKDYFYRTDHHWTTSGAAEMAQAVRKAVETLPSYKKIPKIPFKTSPVKEMTFEGSFSDVYKSICGSPTAMEKDQEFETVAQAAVAGAGEGALFGDMPEPEIVLVGTSYSHREQFDVNFEGALKEALSADVRNNAISGGGFDDPMIAYLASEGYRKHPPKILIWEFPGYYDVSGDVFEKMLREAIAAVYGECGGKALASSGPVTLSEKKTTLFDNLAKKNIPVSDAYLRLVFAMPVKKNFAVTFRNVEGQRENVKFRRSKRYPFDGIFDYAPEIEGNSPLNSVTITVPDELEGEKVEARLCPFPKQKKSLKDILSWQKKK